MNKITDDDFVQWYLLLTRSILSTQVVVSIIADNLAAALPLLVSCTKRRIPEIITIVVIIITVTASSSPGSASQIICKSRYCRQNKQNRCKKELIKALQIRVNRDSFCPCVTTLSPYRSRACSTIPDGNPLPVVPQILQNCVHVMSCSKTQSFIDLLTMQDLLSGYFLKTVISFSLFSTSLRFYCILSGK